MEIATLPADDDGYASWYDLLRAARAVDRPDDPLFPRTAVYAGLSKGWPGETAEHWIVRDGDTVRGIAELTFPQLDNRTNAALELLVHPGHRRRGVGGALLAHCVERARAAGRTKLIADVIETWPGGGPERSTAGAAFATRHGAKRALEEIRSRMVVSTGSQPRLDTALAEAWGHASGYSLVRWTEDGTPDDIVADVAALDSDFLNQAPLGELAWEPEKVDVARTRQIEQALRDRGWIACHTAARHDATGDVVAWT
ncbi:MAG: GNAT family N-acetyltransferase, partial [Micromonosporaceae bacterium]